MEIRMLCQLDFATIRKQTPRSSEILADAELLERGGEGFGRGLDPQIIRLHPVKIIAWGIDEKRQSRTMKNIQANANPIHVIV
jgi:hypothetical protein